MKNIQFVIKSKRQTIFYLGIVVILGLGLRLYYFPQDVPIATDGFFSFVYALKTVFEGSFPEPNAKPILLPRFR